MMKVQKVFHKQSITHGRGWPAGKAYYVSGVFRVAGLGTFTAHGYGDTPRRAKIDLLHQQGRRRVSWWDKRYRG